MAQFKIEKECKVTATIVLDDISEEAYEDIARYIRNKVGSFEEPVRSMPCEAISGTVQKTEKRKGSPDERLDRIDGLISDWQKNPGAYILYEMTASEFIEKNPFFAGIHPIAIGKRLHRLSVPYNKVAGRTSGGKPAMITYYQIPVLKETVGTVLRREREASKLNTGEVAELIGYPASSVRAWENGSATPSSEAIGLLEKVFGSNVFDGVPHQS